MQRERGAEVARQEGGQTLLLPAQILLGATDYRDEGIVVALRGVPCSASEGLDHGTAGGNGSVHST